MRRHNIFTLGIILTSIYGINAVADWPTITATDVWTNSGHTTLATKRCGDCCKSDCWLPNGTYYDTKGTFTETCGLSCPSDQYDIGFSSCIYAGVDGKTDGYWNFNGSTRNTTTYGLTAGGQWGVTLYTGDNIKGIASCNSTSGTFGVATNTEFSNTSNGQYCWCKMTEPSASRWVFVKVNGDADSCSEHCVVNCSDAVLGIYNFQRSLFGTVGDTPPTCDSNRTYSVVDGQCKLQKLSCPSGQYDIGFSGCISASTNGSNYGYRGFDGNTYNTTTYGLNASGLWAAEFSYGVVKGIASCNSTSGTYGVATTANFSNVVTGEYCWCKMTEPFASRWVFYDNYFINDFCAYECVLNCSELVRDHSDFRSGMFGSVGN